MASNGPGEHIPYAEIGQVSDNKDEQGLGRVKVTLPTAQGFVSDWARVLTPMGGKSRGIYFLPEVDDQVLVLFVAGQPYVLGALWNKADAPPETNGDGKNNKRLIKSRSGHLIRLDDTDGGEKIEIVDTSGKNSITISTNDNSITIAADADITIKSSSGKLSLSGTGIEIKSQAGVTIEASQNMDLKANGPTTVKGATVAIN